MKPKFTAAQLERVSDQALIYQCACPAAICALLNEIGRLYAYQQKCLEQTSLDRAVHERIAEMALRLRAEAEVCLEDVLQMEGWNLDTLEMPASLQKRLLKEVDAG